MSWYSRTGENARPSLRLSFFNSIVGFEATDAATAVVDGTRLESSFKIGVTREDSKLWGAVLTFYPLRKITE